LTLVVKQMLHFGLFLLKGKIYSGTRPHCWSYIYSECTCFCFSNCRTSKHVAFWYTLSQSWKTTIRWCFQDITAAWSLSIFWVGFYSLFPSFHRQLNIHKSSCRKRSALTFSWFWAVVHSCFLGNAYGIFSHLFAQRNFSRVSHLLLKRMAGLPSVVNILSVKTQQF